MSIVLCQQFSLDKRVLGAGVHVTCYVCFRLSTMASSDESPTKKRFWREETSRDRRRVPSTSKVRDISTESRPSHTGSNFLQTREERRQSSRNREEEKRSLESYPVERMGRQASRREPDPEEIMGRQTSRREPDPVVKNGKGHGKNVIHVSHGAGIEESTI